MTAAWAAGFAWRCQCHLPDRLDSTGRRWGKSLGTRAFAILVATIASLVALLAGTTTNVADEYRYDDANVARVDARLLGAIEATSTLFSGVREHSTSPLIEGRRTSTTPFRSLVATQAASPWSLGPSPRGFAIEEALGGNLPRSFPTIDSFANGTATSIKSIDLTASSYQSAGRLTSRLNGYVDSVAGFDGAVFDGVRVAPGATTTRELVVAIQPGVASSAQQAALTQVVQYGASNGVTVRVVSVP